MDWRVCMMPLWCTKETWVFIQSILSLSFPLCLSFVRAVSRTPVIFYDSRHGKKRQKKEASIQNRLNASEGREMRYSSRAWLTIATLLP